ncbi:uncharacterized protein DUF4105 [Rhodobacter aestuarii]|uniref:Lnb N-terminal periplasmic domain-containing protein n=1 Tax=Rhodobacter aestuarii TaxID=453582 RepID=A0A1N7IUY0_9RHOB|nr:DUF4105 domain-containing protein [Rhodobacter aestuarii]PTV97512.1 uncharacterized protein DUF4105 [Rhodobacter aestuarii]SIS40781.1 protein of unknown function [Rhodobacter aestuarii]
MPRLMTVLAHVLFVLILVLGSAWAATALWLHLAGALRLLALAGLTLAVMASLAARFLRSRRMGWLLAAFAALLVGGWYQTITPRQDRDWAVDVARGVTADISGETITLGNIRDFDWHSETEATQRWISETVDLNDLETVDMFTSIWDSPDIAHLLVSFGFTTGEHVVFSVEIRREEGEKFNEIGGFFRQFELVLIGATERDIVQLRTNYRQEQVRLYPIALSPDQRRTIFLSYVTLAQELQAAPQFYNTLTANCTTVVWQLAHSLKPDLPLDWRLVLSGHLPDYLTDLGVVSPADPGARDASALITLRAQRDLPGVSFSDKIRQPE